MCAKNREPFEKRLTSLEPSVRETLADEILQDVAQTLNDPLNDRRFDVRVHCTKTSRCRSTFWGAVCGMSIGTLAGVLLTLAVTGIFRPASLPVPAQQIAVESKPQNGSNADSHVNRHNEYSSGHTTLARADELRYPIMSDVDRLIEQANERAKRLQTLDDSGRRYAYTSNLSPAALSERIEQWAKNRELVEHFLQ